MLKGEDIYSPISFASIDPQKAKEYNYEFIHPNLNPPVQTLLFAPMALLSYQKSFYLFTFLSFLLGSIAVFWIHKALFASNKKATRSLIFLSLLFFCYMPSLNNLLLGQFGMVIFFLITAAWWTGRKKNYVSAGFLLGFAFCLKLFVGLYLVFLFFYRQWKTLLSMVITTLACHGVAILFLGIGQHLRYFEVLGQIEWYTHNKNASFTGFFSRIFNSENALYRAPWAGQILIAICSVATLGLLIYFSYVNSKQKNQSSSDALFCATSLAMLLVSPLAWTYYFPVLFLATAILWNVSANFENKVSIRFLTITAWILSTWPYRYVPPEKIFGVWMSLGLPIAGFYGLVIFYVTVTLSLKQISSGLLCKSTTNNGK